MAKRKYSQILLYRNPLTLLSQPLSIAYLYPMNKTAIKISALLLICLLVAAGIYYTLKQKNDSGITQFWDTYTLQSTQIIDHGKWQLVLEDYLIADHESGINRVDYEALIDDKALLEEYINTMAKIDPREHNKDEQMAYWINLYNALTVLLIVDEYPTQSITKLGETTIAFGPWDDFAITVSGQDLSLNDIEHRILRPIWQDDRIHFAVNCASIGCPNLQAEVFTSDNLNTLLDIGAEEYLAHPRALRFEEDTLILSSLFEWYASDFGSDLTATLAKLSEYAPDELKEDLKEHKGEIKYEYDWGLNRVDF